MADLPVLSSLSNHISNPIALAGLSLLLPVIILYLLKPKPKHLLFPSTMFIRFIEKHKRFSSFLQKFIKDPILLMQLIIITVLVFSIANPFTKSMETVRSQESIAIVLDGSASMQATDADTNRFSKALESAMRVVSDLGPKDEATVILAENIPVTILNRGSRNDAMNVLSRLEAADTPSNVGDAILLARDLLSGANAKRIIYVFSDFSEGDGLEPSLGRRIASLSGCEVKFVRVGGGSSNAGVVGFTAKRSAVDENRLFAAVTVKNSGAARAVKVSLLSNGNVIDSSEKSIAAGGEDFYTFNPNVSSGEQVIEARLEGGDHLEVDDIAYAYVPAVKTSRILLLTGEGDSDKYLRLMLQSMRGIELTMNVPPEPIRDFSRFDVVVLGDAGSSKILPGTFSDISGSVSKGSDLVVVATENLWGVKDGTLWSMLPVSIAGWGAGEAGVEVYEEHDMLADVVFENVVAKKYFMVNVKGNDSRQIVGTKGADPVPLLSYRKHGRGYVAYVGLNSNPAWSNLYYSSSFPILWSQMVKYFTLETDTEAVQDYSSGTYMPLNDVLDVKTPSGSSLRTNNVFLDKVGVYEVSYPAKSSKVTVSLLNPRESNITAGDVEESVSEDEFSAEREKVEVRHDYYRILLGLMLAVLVFEMILYRRRGVI